MYSNSKIMKRIFSKEVDRYNEAQKAGVDEDFGRP